MRAGSGKVDRKDDEVGDVKATMSDNDLTTLSSEDWDVLVLIEAHAKVTAQPAARRTTLEAYARESGLWDATNAGLRRVLSYSLNSLRTHSLVALHDDGFSLTDRGREMLASLERSDQQIDQQVSEASVMIGDLERDWRAKAS